MGRSLTWLINTRGNLDLWPDPSPNIAGLARLDRAPYDEDALLASIKGTPGTGADNTRAVRNTVEVLAYSGLGSRHEGRFALTNLGRMVLSFLGAVGPAKYASAANRQLLARLLIRGLASVPEYRAIWRLMLACDCRLSNEELNRCLPIMVEEESVADAAARVITARSADDPTIIGPRVYDDVNYGTDKSSDQRKAMNPQFLLASGGKVFIELGNPYRIIPEWAADELRVALQSPATAGPLSTDFEFANSISRASGAYAWL